MNTIDMKIISVDTDGNVTFTFSNIGGIAVGTTKLAQKYLRYFYGEDCGRILYLFTHDKLTTGNVGTYINAVTSAVIRTNEKIIEIQKNLDLHPDETFIDCKVTKIDVLAREGIIDINLRLVTQSGELLLTI